MFRIEAIVIHLLIWSNILKEHVFQLDTVCCLLHIQLCFIRYHMLILVCSNWLLNFLKFKDITLLYLRQRSACGLVLLSRGYHNLYSNRHWRLVTTQINILYHFIYQNQNVVRNIFSFFLLIAQIL